MPLIKTTAVIAQICILRNTLSNLGCFIGYPK